MAENVEVREAFTEALDTEDWDRVEELWLEALDDLPASVNELLEVRRLVWKAGRKNLGRTLLELLADSLEAQDLSTEVAEREIPEREAPQPIAAGPSSESGEPAIRSRPVQNGRAIISSISMAVRYPAIARISCLKILIVARQATIGLDPRRNLILNT